MTDPIYAIGDVHGQKQALDQALEWIAADGGADAEIVFLGDYVDRGPDSRAVIDCLASGIQAGRNWHVLRGNHDRMFCRFYRSGILGDARIKSGLEWLHPRLGGVDTLASYGVSAAEDDPVEPLLEEVRRAVPEAHIAFLEERPLYLETNNFLFVHAGILPGVPLADQIEDDLIWIRDPFLMESAPHPWLVVHGHTALDYPQHFGNRIDLDGGAGYGRMLYPAVFEDGDAWLLNCNGREALRP
ncbi:metallophosphoesterase family protein [Thalassococcus sp. S3]|uniref:metallophosphoesterase family protein n=1 Tax=Thalassococcus sp. S3 TaxID=2017482 RepID=UPI0010242E7B|nr:metallophosphoesterase family protein [Thalassococcus sp. S3]QBF29786.1 serine/threonine protein phosphatase [Thalassococcus sp. S3]